MEQLIKSGKTNVFKYCIATVFGLILLKSTVSWRTSSLGVLGSAVDSFLDLFSSMMNWFSLVQAEKPADAEHQYGHGKIESLAGLFQSIILTLTAFYLVVEAIRRFQKGSVQIQTTEAILTMIVSMFATTLLVLKLKRAEKDSDSLILKAERLHFQSDILSNLGIIFSLILVGWTQRIEFDFLAGILVAIYILSQSLPLLKTSVDELLDRALPSEEIKKIKDIILNFDPRICSFHEFRTRKLGSIRFIEFHIEIRDIESFIEAHALTEQLIVRIQEQFSGADVTIHYDPEGAE